jgi:Universal stress protein family
MTKVLAVVDGPVEPGSVITIAGAVADVMGAEVQTQRLRERTTWDDLADAISVPEVVAAVLGFLPPSPLTPTEEVTALELSTIVNKPLVLVPPKAPVISRLRRVLVPIEGDPDTSATMRDTIRLACDWQLEIVVLHVRDTASLPMFEDQPQHETDAWIQEFLARYVSVPAATVRLELRVGTPDVQIPAAAIELEPDLVALGSLRDSSPGHATVIRSALEHCTTPVLLMPLVRRLVLV